MSGSDDKSYKVTDKRNLCGEHETKEGEMGDFAHNGPAKFDFASFVSSLHFSALVSFGLIQDPSTGSSKADTELAKQNIDLLEMLEEKTKGNLTQDELRLLESVLYDLRMKYVELIKKKG